MVLYCLVALANQRNQLLPLLQANQLLQVGLGFQANQLFPLLLLNLLLRLSLVPQQVLRLQRLRLNLGHLAHLLHRLNH